MYETYYYYIDRYKEKVGPLSFEELIKCDLTPQTPIKLEGRGQWTPAYHISELQFLFTKEYSSHSNDRFSSGMNSGDNRESVDFERREEEERWREMTHMNRTEDYDRIDDDYDSEDDGYNRYESSSDTRVYAIGVFVAICLLCGILFLVIA